MTTLERLLWFGLGVPASIILWVGAGMGIGIFFDVVMGFFQ